jgi:hypothetical protein
MEDYQDCYSHTWLTDLSASASPWPET